LVLAGFSFGAYVQCQVCQALSPQRVVLIGPAVNLFEFGTAPSGVVVIHGEKDELVPLEAVRAWSAPLGVQVEIVAGADHFFHRKLSDLKRTIIEQCQL
jgi:hypothetical protein